MRTRLGSSGCERPLLARQRIVELQFHTDIPGPAGRASIGLDRRKRRPQPAFALANNLPANAADWLRPFMGADNGPRAGGPSRAARRQPRAWTAVNATLMRFRSHCPCDSGPIRAENASRTHAIPPRHSPLPPSCWPPPRRRPKGAFSSSPTMPTATASTAASPTAQPCGAAAAAAYCKSKDFAPGRVVPKVDKDEITGAIPTTTAQTCRGGTCDQYVAIECSR